jgi:hypothetical protein
MEHKVMLVLQALQVHKEHKVILVLMVHKVL